MSRRRLGTLQRGDDESRIGLALGPLGLGDDATPATVDRAALEVLEAVRRLAARLGRCPSSDELLLNHGSQALVARQPEHIIHAVLFAPRHQGLARKAAIAPQQDPYMGPAIADLPHDPLDLLDVARVAVDIGAAQLGGQKMSPAKNIERQIAIAVVITLEEATLLMPIQRVVGGVKIEDDLPGRPFVQLQEQRHRQRLGAGVGGTERRALDELHRM